MFLSMLPFFSSNGLAVEGFFDPVTDGSNVAHRELVLNSTVSFHWDRAYQRVTGGGFWISPDGLALTAYHVMKPCIDLHKERSRATLKLPTAAGTEAAPKPRWRPNPLEPVMEETHRASRARNYGRRMRP
jgi:hypothetical protein